jgi:protein ImuB
MKPLALPLPFPEPAAAKPRTPSLRSIDPPIIAPQPRQATRRRAVWLAVHLRGWPLHAALAALTEGERSTLIQQPLAVVDGDRRSTVLACNELAAAFGIRAGHSLNAAIALCSDMQFLARVERLEADLLTTVASCCEKFTSFVSLELPNEILLEVRGSFRLFGGIDPLLAQVREVLEAQGLTPQLALSPTAQSALWLSRSAADTKIVKPHELLPTITRLAVSHLQWPAELELRLARFGVLAIGDLLRLPRGSLARRIGYDRLAELDHAIGRHPQVRASHRPHEPYEDRILLDFEIETTGLLTKVIEKRLARLARYLRIRTVAVDHLHLELLHRDHVSTPIKIGLASATADVTHIAKLMQEHLGRVALAAPVKEVVLRVERFHPAPTASRELFRAASSRDHSLADTQPQARLLEQLRARLGEDAVCSIAAAADFRPECANRLDRVAVGKDASLLEISPRLAPRPLWLLAQPRLIAKSAGTAARLKVLIGPESIEAGWWDGLTVSRDYFHARSAEGARAWIYRDRLQPDHWFLHGLFG